jgi:hypothetical protein
VPRAVSHTELHQKRFLNHAVETGVEWPRLETTIDFGGWKIIAFPPTADHDASLHLDVAAYGITLADGMSVLNQFLSIAAWLDDIFAVLLPGLAGSGAATRQPRQTRLFPTSVMDGWTNSWQPIHNERVRLAVAIYREAVNMQRYHSLPYAVVGFYRILELTWPDGKARGTLIEHHLGDILSGDTIWGWLQRAGGYSGDLTPSAVATYLREQCRHAAAHARSNPIINPDDASHQYQMGAAATLLRKLARQAMQADLGISTNRWEQ